MKKIIYSLLIFVSIFFVVDKVSAIVDNSKTIYFDLEHSNFTTVYDDLKPKLESLVKVLNNNPNNYKWVIFFGKNKNGNFIQLNILPSSTLDSPSSSYCYLSYYSSTKIWPEAGCSILNNVAYLKYDYYSAQDIETFLSNVESDMNSNMSSNSYGTYSSGSHLTSLSGVTLNFQDNVQNYFNNANLFVLPYASYNYRIHYYESQPTFNYYKVQFGENELTGNGYLESENSYFEEPYKSKRSIEFNSSISSFDIYVDKDDELTNLTYKLNYVDYNDYTTENITKSKLYTVMFYGLKNENGLYHWEMLDDCTNWDYPSEYCHVKSKFEQLESELNKEGFTVEGYIDFLDIFNEYDTVRVVLRLDNALTGKIDYWDKNMKIAATDVDVNYFGFDYSRNLSDSDLYRYTIFSTKEQDLSGNLYIISQSNDITINYFDTKYANFKEYSSLADVKKQENFWLFNYEHIGLNNNLGFYLFTERNLTERLVYQFYTKPELYFSYNDSDTLDGSIYIDNTGNSTNSDIAIDPDELMNYEYETIDDLFENITKFNEKINVVSQEIHKVIQYAYDSLNIYIKSFLISIFTVILVAGTIVLIRR